MKRELKTAKASGFTLAEIIIVITIISIAAMIAVPMLGGAGMVKAKSGANRLIGDMEYAKSLAITRGAMITMRFASDGGSYQIEDSGGVIEDPYKSDCDYVVDTAGDGRLEGLSISNVDFNGGRILKFDYLGVPYDGSDYEIYSGTVTLSGGGSSYTVSVEPVTGYVSLSE